MRQSLLGRLVPLIRQPEPAATQALHYVLEAAPEAASAFVETLMGEPFEIGRIVSEGQFKKGQPDLALHDAQGQVRLFVENKFWAELTRHQPVAYLDALPPTRQSVLAFIAPEDRRDSLWTELKGRCSSENLAFEDETTDRGVRRARVGSRTLVLTSWSHVLDVLQRAAAAGGHAAVEQDIVQLQGLTERMNSDVFPPLGGNEPTNQHVARRLLNFARLIDSITDRLKEDGIADTKGFQPSGWGQYLRVHGTALSLRISIEKWRDTGTTPLWCMLWPECVGAPLTEIAGRFDGAHMDKGDKGRLWIPIPLRIGVERDRVVDDAVRQVGELAEKLREWSPVDG